MHGTGERAIPHRAFQHIQRGGARTVDRPLATAPSLRGGHVPYHAVRGGHEHDVGDVDHLLRPRVDGAPADTGGQTDG